MDGDIKKAYDYVSHQVVAEATRKRGMHEVIIHAWLQEWGRMKKHVSRLDRDTAGDPIARLRS